MIYRPAKTNEELCQILDLQARNLRSVLDPDTVAREGFVTLQHSLELLKRMQVMAPQFIAWDGKQVQGYALCLHPEIQEAVPDLAPMFGSIESHLEPETDYRVMGQVCIAREFRNQGHFRKLYRALSSACSPLPLITEVAADNPRSLGAHFAVGFTELTQHQEGSTLWHVIMLQAATK
ncbi:hypothetical protein SAMN04490243_1344 [Robiginitalea myxolifaciens]|uniref:N-acetyltransferase domain-containing protein n=1 Tax=Robiginitalea myxolifaciens TaxID=400055 RepID=A0A1I6G7F5_9FLAO|nr:hypothetical protein [Robiginitalea myxolifaciens]SFR38051.1 hypothetical protein SAMN04490243_1344 [Robiginitalea myxolifaciens]